MTELEYTRLQDDGNPNCPEHWDETQWVEWAVCPVRRMYRWWWIWNAAKALWAERA